MNKKRFLAGCLVLSLLSFNTTGFAYAIPATHCNCNVSENVASANIPIGIENELKQSITNVYGKDKTEEMYSNIQKLVYETRKNRDSQLAKEDLQRTSDWYKDEIVYMFYAEQFGVKDKNHPNTFKDLIGRLDYLKKLGVTTIYILPFMESPMGDAGFDVSNPRSVRKDLGGTEEFKQFTAEARKRGLKIKADLILNHFSDQHEWFQQILKGDLSKLNYFVVSDKMPVYKKYMDPQKGIVVDYQEDNNKISSRRLMFPDICENNYRKVTINGKDYYFYHTFYPFQLDVNWQNPEVLYYMLGTIAQWANTGIDIFRMDAIPYFIKKPGTNAENLQETHDIVTILSLFLQLTAPRSVIQAEACQWPKDILPYFGKENNYNLNILNKEKNITRTNQVQIAYNFPYMPAIWATMLTGDNQHFWDAYNNTPVIPNSAAWALFLRVHDELTLEMVDINTRKLVYDKLLDKGAEFRKGLGISGRMANFLDKDPQKIGMAFSILLSLPGLPIIYYGDEIGALNNWDYANNFAKIREKTQKAKNPNIDVLSFFDSRDINRGPITQDQFDEAVSGKDKFGNQVYTTVSDLIKIRKQEPVLREGTFNNVITDKTDVFTFLRQLKNDKIIVVNNLINKDNKVRITLDKNIVKDIKSKNSTFDLVSRSKVNNINIISANEIEINLKPYQYLWLKIGAI